MTRSEAQRGIAKSGKRRLAIGVNTLVALLLAGVLLGMVNYLGHRHFHRADWSRSQFYSLSGKTCGLLEPLTNTIEVLVFFQPGHPVYTDVENLLKEYEATSKLIHVKKVDPDRDLARAQELEKKYAVTEPNVVVFACGDRSKYLTEKDLIQYDYRSAQQGKLPTKLAFKGEQAFSSAIQSITEERMLHVYMLQGHGERDPESFDEHTGYSAVAKTMSRDNLIVSKLVLGTKQAIPEDCDALIIAGATKRFSQPEVDIIRSYMEKSGRLLIAMDPMEEVGLAPLLEDWGVRLEHDMVVDATRTLTGRELFITEKDYGPHAITEKLQDVSTIFYLPRSVQPLQEAASDVDQADKPHVSILAQCSEHGWAERDLEEHPMKYDVGRDEPGPIAVAVAVEKGPILGIDVAIKPTRMVVFGDSDFISNGAITGGNMDLFMSGLNWLLEREALMAIGHKPMGQQRLDMTRVELTKLFWVAVVGMPGAIALLGCIVWFRRRA